MMMIHFIKFHIIQAARKKMLTQEHLDWLILLCVALKGEIKK